MSSVRLRPSSNKRWIVTWQVGSRTYKGELEDKGHHHLLGQGAQHVSGLLWGLPLWHNISGPISGTCTGIDGSHRGLCLRIQSIKVEASHQEIQEEGQCETTPGSA